jgi:hypothetical protein
MSLSLEIARGSQMIASPLTVQTGRYWFIQEVARKAARRLSSERGRQTVPPRLGQSGQVDTMLTDVWA